jgi:hypothetical protein
MRTRFWLVVIGLPLALAAGCGASKAPKSSQAKAVEKKDAAGADKAKEPADKDVQPLPRKIIYTADVELIVKDLATAEEELKQLVKQRKGYMAQSELTGSAGSPRRGHWRIRIPVDDFESFLDEIIKLGVPYRNTTDTEDVTDKFYDLQARIKNRKAEEESLRKLLEKTNGKMEDILAVRRELNQVRNDIDVQEGQLRRLDNLTTLTTIDLTMKESEAYLPPTSFGGTIASTFSGSVDWLIAFGKGIVLVVVALVPWLAVLAVIVTPLWILLRRRGYFQSGRRNEIVTVEPVGPEGE